MRFWPLEFPLCTTTIVIAIAVFGATCAAQGFGADRGADRSNPSVGNTSCYEKFGLSALDKEWNGKCRRIGAVDPVNSLGKWLEILVPMVNERMKKGSESEFIKCVLSGPAVGERSDGFVFYTVQALAIIFVEHGDRGSLVELLSRRCPDRISQNDIEFYIAYDGRKSLTDGIDVLFDAYAKSTDANVKAEIATAVRRAFRANGLARGTNDQTILECRRWYADHRGSIEPSAQYAYNNSLPGPPYAAYQKHGLYVAKSGGAKPSTNAKQRPR